MEAGDGPVQLTATDGYRLHDEEVAGSVQAESSRSVPTALTEMRSSLGSSKTRESSPIKSQRPHNADGTRPKPWSLAGYV